MILNYQFMTSKITALNVVSLILRSLFGHLFLRQVYDCKDANIIQIQSAASSIDWELLFRGANAKKKR